MDRFSLTDAQWEKLKEFIPAPKEGPQESKCERREIANAMLYQKRTRCQWRGSPRRRAPRARRLWPACLHCARDLRESAMR